MSALFHYISLPSFLLSIMLHMFLGMLWYSPRLFGRAFLRLAHNNKQPTPDPQAMLAAAFGTTLAMPFFSLLLAVVDARTPGEAALWGLALGFFLDAGLNLPHSFFEHRPFALYVLHRGYHLVSLTLCGAMLGALCGGP